MKFDNIWMLEAGGISKQEILSRLAEQSVKMNEYANTLFRDEAFTTTDQICKVQVVGLSVGGMGLMKGALYSDIISKATEYGLSMCSLELAVHFRLQYLDQPIGPMLTIASKKTRDDESYPNGFYLRRLEDGLWLRGYRATSDWLFSPEDRFAFLQEQGGE